MSTATRELTDKLKRHDWYYARSDDKYAYQRGVDSYDELCTAFHALPVSEARTLWLSLAPDEFKPPKEKNDSTTTPRHRTTQRMR